MLHFKLDMPLSLMAFYGSLMIIAICLLRLLLKKRMPKFVFPLLWGLALVRLLVPFSLSTPISAPVPQLPLPYQGPQATAVLQAGTASNIMIMNDLHTPQITETISDSSANWPGLLLLLYCLGAATTAGVLLYQKYRYESKLKDSYLVEHNETINNLLRQMDMGHVLVMSCDAIASPLVCGLLRPRIYLPTRMDFENTQLLGHILTHETMHIKRRDNWSKLCMVAALCLHWYNPLVWLMSQFFSSDLETACDNGVLRQLEPDQRQNYAYSLLAMAITGNRPTLLYSAFSKTQVEKRIRNVLQYKKTTALALALSVALLLCSTVAFSAGGQAPFSPDFTRYCAVDSCNWGVKAQLARDIALGKDAQEQAESIVFDQLEADQTGDPDILRDKITQALAKEFGVEPGAFALTITLCPNGKELDAQYAALGLTQGPDGWYLYKGEQVRRYQDEMLFAVRTRPQGTVDVRVVRNRLGEILSLAVTRQGDPEFDKHTKELRRSQTASTSDGGTTVVLEKAASRN